MLAQRLPAKAAAWVQSSDGARILKDFFLIQLWPLPYQQLHNKPYVNEVTLREQNLYQKSCYSSELKICMFQWSRSSQRGPVASRNSGFVRLPRFVHY